MNNKFNVRRTVTMVCAAAIYDKITADNEVTSVGDSELNMPIKYVYDPEVRIYYIILKSTPKMEEKIGNNDIVVLNNSQFGDEPVTETELFGSIARITKFADHVREATPEEDVESEVVKED